MSEPAEASYSAGDVLDDQTWSAVWETLGRMDSVRNRYVLIAEGQRDNEHFAALANLPFGLVLDLDWESDTTGLYSLCADRIRQRQRLRVLTGEGESDIEAMGVNWVMSNGWRERGMPIPDAARWQYTYAEKVRDIAKQFYQANAERNIIILVLPGLTDADRPHHVTRRCLEIIDETCRGEAKFLTLGDIEIPDLPTAVPLEVRPSDFARTLATKFSDDQETAPFSLPAVDGEWAEIALQNLVLLEDNLDVLHTGIIQRDWTVHDIEFWKGRTPTWGEIAANVDIRRRAVSAKRVGSLFVLLRQ